MRNAKLGLVFFDNIDEAIVYHSADDRFVEVELTPNYVDTQVTAANLGEYLQLFAQHRLVGAIQPQIEAFRVTRLSVASQCLLKLVHQLFERVLHSWSQNCRLWFVAILKSTWRVGSD